MFLFSQSAAYVRVPAGSAVECNVKVQSQRSPQKSRDAESVKVSTTKAMILPYSLKKTGSDVFG